MRSEQEMLALILDTAREDERIRAVILNGSRTNPNAPRDIFQDYDIVYLVAEIAPFVRNVEWIARFGPMMILQMPDDMGEPLAPAVSYSYLMQFADGNRIDLTIYPMNRLEEMERDSLSILLLEKDGVVEPFPPPNERGYLPSPPTAKAFDDACNEFWWVATYVAKGLWRNEIIYAKYHLDEIVRAQLMKMLTWYFGVKTGFQQSPGKVGRNFPRFLEPELWQMLLESYADVDVDRTWNALFTMCALFRRVAMPVAEQFGYTYPHGDDQRVSAHLERVRRLPNAAADLG